MLGSSLCRLFYNEHEIYALHRDEECFSICSADYSLDLKDLIQLQTIFNKIKPDLVIHCASLTSVDECEAESKFAYATNVMVTENIARICSDGIKLVHISTDQVYGETADHSEDNDALHPINQYGKTKLQGEQKVQEHCPDHIIIRTNIFGWNVKPGKTSSGEWIYNSLRNGQKITLFSDYIFSPVYTKYLGEAILGLVHMNFSGVINVGSPIQCSKYDFGQHMAEIFGFDQSLISRGSIKEHSFIAKRCAKLDLNCSRLIKMKMDIPTWRQSILGFSDESNNLRL